MQPNFPLSPLRQIVRSRTLLTNLLETLPYLQSQCQHEHIGHSLDSERLPVRICLHCGLEESGSAFSNENYWTRRGYDSLSKLGNMPGRSVQTIEPVHYQEIRVRAA